MNILKDQRERFEEPSENAERKESQVFPEGSEEKPEAPSRTEEPVLEEPASPEKREFKYSYKGGKKKSNIGPFLLVFAVLVIAVIVIYFFFFRGGSEDAWPPAMDQAGQADFDSDFAESTAVGDEGLEDLDTGESSEPAPSPPVGEPPAASADAAVVNVLNALARITATEMTLRTLYLDENSFSAEFQGAQIEEVFNRLRRELPPAIKMNSSTSRTGGTALISGTFPARSASTFSGSEALSADQAGTMLKEKAASAGASVAELSVSPNPNNILSVFLRLEGTVAQVRSFVFNLLGTNWNFRISKIIIMPSSGQQATTVLRLQLFNPN